MSPSLAPTRPPWHTQTRPKKNFTSSYIMPSSLFHTLTIYSYLAILMPTTWYKVLGHHGIRKENSNDTLVLTLCAGRQLVTTNALFTQRIALRRLGDTHALVIGIKLILSSSDKKTDHALLKSKVSISFQLKRQHQRVQLTKKLDVAKLANSETQDTLRDYVSSAMEDLVDRH